MYDVIIGRSEEDREKLGTKGAILLGKHFVKMGRVTSLSNPVYLDMTRSHVVFICGKRGSGKCLVGETLITLGDGSVRRIDSLEQNDQEILALQPNLKMHSSQKEGFYKRTVGLTYHIKLRSGKELRLTPEHPLLTIQGWVPVEQLNVGSRIATPRASPVFGEEDMEEARIKLLAYLIAEGHLGNGFVLFSNNDRKIMADFNTAVWSFDSQLSIKKHGPGNVRVVNNSLKAIVSDIKRDQKGRILSVKRDRKNSLRKWLESLDMYPLPSHNKFIPEGIFTLPKHKLSLFLNRLFSCDGSIYEKSPGYWQVSYCSISKRLTKQVQHLLSRFGIVSMMREKRTKSAFGKAFELMIDGAFVKTFLDEIGFFGKKEARQKKALKEAISIRRNANHDTIPKEIWESYRPENWAGIGRRMGYAHPKALRESARYAPTRQKLLQIAMYDEQEALMLLATSDIYWDEITAVEKLEEEIAVYDLTVPEHHNFVANDIIVHNSYTMGAIAEGMADLPKEIKQNISVIMLDTMGIYWTMKYPNRKEKEKELLAQWGLESKGLDVVIYTPTGYYQDYKEKGIPTDKPFSIKPGELDPGDWLMTLGVQPEEPVGVLIERVVHSLTEAKGDDYGIDEVMQALLADQDADHNTRLAAKNRFENVKGWGLFSSQGTPLADLAKGGQVTVLDVSCYATLPGGWNIKNLVVGLVSQKLFIHRMVARKDEEYREVHKSVNPFSDEDETKQDYPLVWLIIDEAHEFLPVSGKTLATDPLVTILREGRQPGISLVLATQQPGKIHTDVMTQSDTVISHRITAKIDTEALGMLMQSYMRKGLVEELDQLPRVHGAAIVFDDTNERLYPMRVRPRFTWHGGESPNAMKNAKQEFKF